MGCQGSDHKPAAGLCEDLGFVPSSPGISPETIPLSFFFFSIVPMGLHVVPEGMMWGGAGI
jgi:hypothetical protein